MTDTKPARLLSLDIFRGITIAWMILANQAGVSPHVYTQLDHAAWNGITMTDFVFPFFLFAVGMSLSFSLAKHRAPDAAAEPSIYPRLLRRAAILFVLGLLLSAFPHFQLSHLRLFGVLQRIALCYLLAAALALKLSDKKLRFTFGGLLAFYWLALTYIPVPGYGPGVLTRDGNFGAWLDRLLVSGAHLYQHDGWRGMGDPEGLFGTLPALASTLSGYLAGNWVRKNRPSSLYLALAGAALAAAGLAWAPWFPINKKLWTSSYALLTSGAALLLFSACYEAADRRGLRLLNPFSVMGMNAIFAYAASVVLLKTLYTVQAGGQSLSDFLIVKYLEPAFGPYGASTLFALMTVAFWWLVLYGMYRKKWFFKI